MSKQPGTWSDCARSPFNRRWTRSANLYRAVSQSAQADGTACGDDCDYLAKNGLAFGRVYGFAVPDATPDRDPWHKDNDRAKSPGKVDGVFAQTAWQWDGVVRNFEYDQAWDFQEPPTTGPAPANYKFWTAKVS